MESVIYIVQPGDTLYAIAEKYNTTVNHIARFNGIADPNVIDVEQVLRIPITDDPEKNYEEYTVESGDTLYLIARNNGVSVCDLINMNRLTNPDLIYPGQIILIPK